MECVFGFDFLIGIDAKCGKNKSKDENSASAADSGTNVESCGSGDESADCINEIADSVSYADLETDAAPEPLRGLHFGVHCADSGKARRRKEVKHEVSESCNGCDTECCGNGCFGAFDHCKLIKVKEVGDAVAYCECTDNVFLCDEACNSGSCHLPCGNTDNGYDKSGDRSCDGCEDGRAFSAFFNEVEAPVKGLHYIYCRIAEENDRSRFYNVRPAALTHGLERSPKAREFIFGKLDNEEGFSVFVACYFVNEKCAEKDEDDAYKIHERTDPF